MFSTGSASGSHDGTNYPTQWALNPSAYQNVANDQIDWAALAQQWIMMKEAAPVEAPITQATLPAAAPASTSTNKKETADEGGEAPMDVENDKEEPDWTADVGSGGQEWSNWQQNWGWNASWNGPSGVPAPATVNNTNKSALLPTPYSHYPAQSIESNSNLEYQKYVLKFVSVVD